jgi:hypothetical protein
MILPLANHWNDPLMTVQMIVVVTWAPDLRERRLCAERSIVRSGIHDGEDRQYDRGLEMVYGPMVLVPISRYVIHMNSTSSDA